MVKVPSKCLLFLFLFISIGSDVFSQQPETDSRGLKDYYRSFFPIGVAITPNHLGDSVQRNFILKNFNSITAENAMKMEPIHPEEHRYNWKDADAMVNFATQHKLKVRGHTLCWYNQTPKWIFYDQNGELVTKEILLDRLKSHIHTVVKRYKGKIYAWDVVNEAVSDNPKEFLRNSLWYQICGEDFISKAFQYAHEADPDAILFYNDYNTESPDKRNNILRLLKKLRDNGMPVHAVGLQGHWNILHPNPDNLSLSIQQYAAIGLKVQITELDISVYTDDKIKTAGFSTDMQNAQADQYAKIFKVFRDAKQFVTGVTFWNLSDRSSWLDNFPVRGRKNFPLLFDENLQPKAAYWKVIEHLR